MIAFPWRRRPPPAPPLPRRRRFFSFRRLANLTLILLIGAFIITVLFPYVVVTVPTGHVGVLWKRFGIFSPAGTALNPRDLKEEGLHIIFPWNILFFYDLRLQTITQTYNAISKDGVNLTATISIRFQVKHDIVPLLHKFIGPEYAATVLVPGIGSRAREVISQYTAEEVYSTKRQAIEDAIRESAQRRFGEQLDRLLQMQAMEEVPASVREQSYSMRTAIQVYDTPVLGITLPQPIVDAIDRKIAQYYLVQEYDFRIERERKESERKRIEAVGIHDFQQIVSQGISDSYLRWRGIEATLQLATSNNAKVVIVGGGKDGLPIILNADTLPASGAPGPGAPAAPGAKGAKDTSGASAAPHSPPPQTDAEKPAASTASPEAAEPKPPPATPAPDGAPLSGASPPAPGPRSEAPSSWSLALGEVKEKLAHALTGH